MSARQVELLRADSVADHYLQRLTTPLIYEALALLVSLSFNLLGICTGCGPGGCGWRSAAWGSSCRTCWSAASSSRRRQQVRDGLPRLADLLAITASGGAGIELATQ